MKGKKSWQLLKKYWGAHVSHCLFTNNPIFVVAKNGFVYRIQIIISSYDPHYSRIEIKNVTTCQEYCYHLMEEGYPIADELYNLLETIRVRPDLMEKNANKSVDIEEYYKRCSILGFIMGEHTKFIIE